MSVLTDMVVNGFAASLDPMNTITRDFMGTKVNESKVNTIGVIRDEVVKTEKALQTAKDNNASAAVIECYEKLLASLNALAG